MDEVEVDEVDDDGRSGERRYRPRDGRELCRPRDEEDVCVDDDGMDAGWEGEEGKSGRCGWWWRAADRVFGLVLVRSGLTPEQGGQAGGRVGWPEAKKGEGRLPRWSSAAGGGRHARPPPSQRFRWLQLAMPNGSSPGQEPQAASQSASQPLRRGGQRLPKRQLPRALPRQVSRESLLSQPSMNTSKHEFRTPRAAPSPYGAPRCPKITFEKHHTAATRHWAAHHNRVLAGPSLSITTTIVVIKSDCPGTGMRVDAC